ncbi:hypothetical protein [Marinimicrobium sp. ABcell2]|uniref:hypothetical protein n=1 Tax=Marinimicrobium sp. ABcell2 TaxID=3069751 RepID=UPI0027AFEF2F|nr:hypothetical protein [Marinimicrobium sp. ABcell2]MDQ2076227.1 hypothetical protein [Marinimicrobium sp. ABcell2]
MRKFGFIVATILFSSNVFAEGAISIPQPSLAIAVAETGAALDRPALELPGMESLAHQEERFAESARRLNEEISNRVEQRLQEKLEQQLNLEF